MSGQNGAEEAARLEAALQRIARAATQAESRAYAMAARHASLHDTPPSVTQPGIAQPVEPAGMQASHIAARLDALIADIRGALGEG